ncbi:SUMO ligase siz1 [Orobanche minor]
MGLPQDLADRLLASLSDERVSGLKMQISRAVNLASKSQGFSNSVNVNSKEAVVDSYQMDKIYCLYGSPQPTDSMMKFEDPSCNMWQHIAYMVIPE